MAQSTKQSKLSLQLTKEQLSALQPLIDATGKLNIAGHIQGDKLNISFLACNAAFLACNAAFKIGDSGSGH